MQHHKLRWILYSVIFFNLLITQCQIDAAILGGSNKVKQNCLRNQTINEQQKNNYLLDNQNGDFIISVLTLDDIPSKFIVSRVNGIFEQNITIGLRTIKILNISVIGEILLQEVKYQQECLKYPLGILIADDLWKNVRDKINELQYHIWKLPSLITDFFTKLTLLLYELPWENTNASVDIRAETIDVRMSFLRSITEQQICLKHFTNDDNIIFIIGNNLLRTIKYDNEIGTVFAVPLFGVPNDKVIDDLPINSYMFLESEIIPKILTPNELERELPKFRTTNFLTISSALIDIALWLNEILPRKCQLNFNEIANLSNCHPDIVKDFEIWDNGIVLQSLEDLIVALSLDDVIDDFNLDLFQKLTINNTMASINNRTTELRQIASINFVSNVTTFYHFKDEQNNGYNNSANNTSKKQDYKKFGQIFHCNQTSDIDNIVPFNVNDTFLDTNNNNNVLNNYLDMYWKLKYDGWVAAGLTTSILGILISFAILIFIVVRLCMDDVLEGNPTGTILLLISLILLFASFTPFCIEYVSIAAYSAELTSHSQTIYNTICSVKLFLITMCYSLTFSVLLCRSMMLASIGSEGGFLSHVNGYIQSVICGFTTLVQIGLSTQLLIIMHTTRNAISCNNIYYGNWFWAIIAYNLFLLLLLVLLIPFVYRSQRNYREGLLITIGTILCLIVWCTWIPLCIFGNWWRDIVIPLGVQGTGWAILGGILIPRTFLIVRGIARSDLAQALPSLTSLAFANGHNHNNQYSDQSIYECVNPAMRQRIPDDLYSEAERNRCHSPSEIPTLPLRGASRKLANNYTNSLQSTMQSSNKATRF